MKTIVALIDFSDVTHKVIQQSEAMAKAFQAKVILLHAVPDVPVLMDMGIVSPTVLEPASDDQKELDYTKLTNLRNALASGGVNVSVNQLEDGNLEGLFEQCERLSADLIIVGAHHHSSLYNWWVGTCTNDVLKRAHCPVLVVPADAS
jgi:nucleotide-binding universal stress UspA family protein